MALAKQVYRSGTNTSIRWYDDTTDEDLFIEHFGITTASTITIGYFAYSTGATPVFGVGINEPNSGQYIGCPRYTMNSTYIRFAPIQAAFVRVSCITHYYAAWVKSGAPTVASNGDFELTVGSNGNGYYAEFRNGGVLDRVVTGGNKAGINSNNPIRQHTTPVSMVTSDFPCFGNIYTATVRPYAVMQNAVSATSFQYLTFEGFALVSNSFSWMAEYIRGS